MDLFAELYGSTIAASWLNLVLYTIELVLAVRYFNHFGTRGPRRFNWIVYLLIANATFGTIANCSTAWLLMVQSPGILPAEHTWPLSAVMISNLIAGTIEQSFLVHRFYRLSGKLSLTIVISILILSHATSSLISSIDLLVHPVYGRNLAIISMTVAFCLSGAIDIVIPLLFVRDLRKIRTSSTSTRTLIRRICMNSLSTGVLVAVTEILVLILFWLQNPFFQIFASALGPLYGLTVLVNLLVCQRDADRAIAERTVTGDLTTGIDTARSGQTGNLTSIFEQKTSPGRSYTEGSTSDSKEGIYICSTDHTASSAC